MDTNIPDGLDAFLAVAAGCKKILNGRGLRACSVDFPHAYKHVPLLKER